MHIHHVKRIIIILAAAMIWGLIPAGASYANEQLDFQVLFKKAIILYQGSPNAIVDLSDKVIDESNYDVTPLASHGRTLVPLRFIGESLGALVSWNMSDSTVAIQGKSLTVKLKLGSTQMSVGGAVKKLDVPMQNLKGRVYVPLRAVSEAFGKQVFFDRGVIVINDAINLNPLRDKDMINYLIETLKPFEKDPYNGRTQTIEKLGVMDQSVVVLESFDHAGNSTGFGSAFAVGPGLFLTNYHVIDHASSYQIVTEQDRYYDVAGVIAADKKRDLALVKTKLRTNVPPLHLGTYKSLVKGQSIWTIGNPDGFQNTLSTGIISGIRLDGDSPAIQMTAPITSGSSGGPLLNMKGEVVGITSMGIEDNGSLNFAVPIDDALSWVHNAKLTAFGYISLLKQSQFESGQAPPEEEPTPEPDNPIAVPAKNVHVLKRVISSEEPHPMQPIVYLADDASQQVVAYNYETEQEVAVSTRLERPIQKMVYARGELIVIMSDAAFSHFRFDVDQGGTIAVLDPTTLKVKDKWRTRIDPYDIVVDKNNHIYVTSGSGQHTYLISYDRVTHEELSSTGISDMSRIALHPLEDKIYAIYTTGSPIDFRVFMIGGGVFGETYDSPYHGDYPLTTVMGITPDGRYILNGYGGIFAATGSKATNMTFLGKIEPFDAMATDPAHPESFLTSKLSTVRQYDSATLGKRKAYNTNGTIVELSEANKRLIALTKVTVRGFAAQQYAIEIMNLSE
ncbi:trypsin-like peptidase domain-containing protein [Paenibacillus sp. OV219]|uniref:trypsin-like peptidase domain-containing protein n=1 Tax=Paenibacillus sp. OV219 TaxID=1884377 RepID=UPI0008C9CAF0|nr:trypsin-like peptidase domain-containing protein [Paenibacillus sp. OV219]SEO83294.1 Copper amine oxidase N-terminal domain-containing protein [Paenibacillus sp. OV219]